MKVVGCTTGPGAGRLHISRGMALLLSLWALFLLSAMPEVCSAAANQATGLLTRQRAIRRGLGREELDRAGARDCTVEDEETGEAGVVVVDRERALA